MAPIFQTGWDGTITFYSRTGNHGKIAVVDGKDNEKGNGKNASVDGKDNGPCRLVYILHHMAADDLAVWEQPRRGQLSFHHALHVLLVHSWLELYAILQNP